MTRVHPAGSQRQGSSLSAFVGRGKGILFPGRVRGELSGSRGVPLRMVPVPLMQLLTHLPPREDGRSTVRSGFLKVGRHHGVHIRIDFMHRHLIGSSTRINGKYSGLVAVVHEDRRDPRQHIVRVLAGRASPAFSLVSEFRPVRTCAWKCRAVRPCCRRRCRQTATCVRAVEWALAGVLPGLGSGMVRGPYAGPATRAGCDPARNLNEWPPGLARRGPRTGEVGKAHGTDRPHPRAYAPTNSPPSAWRSLCGRVRLPLRFRSSAVLSLRGLVAGRPAVAEPRAGRVGDRAARDPRQRVALKT